MPKPLSERLRSLNRRENPLISIGAALRDHVTSLNAPVVGAYKVCCSDESEQESISAFNQQFVRHLLPPLKHSSRSAFRTINLGARCEQGALAIAENHYATPETDDAFKVIVIKINSHVAAAGVREGRVYGRMARYERESLWCGALHAMLDGADLPAINELAAVFGRERLAALRERAKPENVALRMAIASAVLQTKILHADIINLKPLTPTVYVVASCVTFNRASEDTELVVGLSSADSRIEDRGLQYVGLGDDPMAYRFIYDGPYLTVDDSDG